MQQRESQKKEDSPAPNVREVAKCCVFPTVRASGESKNRLVKAAGAESCGQRSNQELHSAVARSAFSSQNAKKLKVSEHFFEVPTSKNCTPLWREARQVRTTF